MIYRVSQHHMGEVGGLAAGAAGAVRAVRSHLGAHSSTDIEPNGGSSEGEAAPAPAGEAAGSTTE